MNYGLSDQVREVAAQRYIEPAIREGRTKVSVAVRDLMRDLEPLGFPARNWPQICTAIQAHKFLRSNGLEIEAVDGPPKKQSPTVIVHYRVIGTRVSAELPVNGPEAVRIERSDETAEEWAHRMTGKLFGLMKEEFAAFGGGEAFLRWVRSEDEDESK
ncbi:MAG TPA: hypothetical protein VME23_06400 [Terracidiphilus sp.]|nr:hypothetical protein [Terracidiphilus sp.]